MFYYAKQVLTISHQEKPFTVAKKKLTVENVAHISVRKLASIIKGVDRHLGNVKGQSAVNARKPQFAFFLGAGASRDSGIILAGQMMKIFKDEIFNNDCSELTTDGEKNKWLKAQKWYKPGKDEYGCLFEQFADTKTERQRFIEGICDRNPLTKQSVEPSFGYVVLADLLLRNYINTVVTTNFHDLVYIASTTFTGNRPIVYAYGILASELKMTSPHSKVLKLHGDYLYSNIVNTTAEMSAQSTAVEGKTKDAREAITSNLNMERQVRTVLDNFGLIVIGYAGNDETIMKLLEQVSENNGFYWCYVKGYPPDFDVLKLVKSKNGRLVEITGFDDLMKEIADYTDFSIDDLIGSFDRRKENLVERITKFNEQYTKKSLGEYAEEITEKQKEKPSNTRSAVDYLVLGFNAQEKNDDAKAESYYRKAIQVNPNYADVYNNLGNLLDKDETRWKEAEENFRKAIELKPNLVEAYSNLGTLLDKDKTRWKEAEAAYRKAIELRSDYAEAYSNLGVLLAKDKTRWKEAEENYNKAIELKPDLAGAFFNLACLRSLESNADEAVNYLKKAVELDDENKAMAKTDSDFDNIRDDTRFKEIVGDD